jgi:antitoxin VapB
MLGHMEIGETRIVSLFRNGSNQALRIPKDFTLASNKAELTATPEGNLLITPIIEKETLADIIKAMAQEGDLDGEFPEFPDSPPEPVDLFS